MRPSRHGTTLLVIIALSLLLRGIAYFSFCHTAMPWFPVEATQTDMHATWEWADRILAGDILGRETYHPGFEWMDQAGRRAEWEARWGDIRIFQQEPLYTYLVATLRWILPSPLHTIPLLQLLLGGILLPLAVHTLGRTLLGPRSALFGAAVAAVFGPGIFYQAALLRDWTVPIGSAFFLALAIGGIRTSNPVRLLIAGLALGIGATMKSTALLWLPVLLCWLWLGKGRAETNGPKLRWQTAALLLGLAVGLMPVVARNAVVGAPLFALSNRLPEGLIQGNAADANPIGLNHPASQDATLKAAGGSALRVAGEILSGYADSPGAIFRVQGAKLLAAFAPEDLADNFAYDYGREKLPILRFCPSWGVLIPLAVPGLFLLLRRRSRRFPWIVGILVSNTLAITLPIALGRYRLEALPLLAISAGHLLHSLVILARRRDWGRLAMHGGAVAALAILCFGIWPPPWIPWNPRQSLQIVERGAAICIFTDQKKFEKAADESAALTAQASLFPEGEAEAIQARQSEILSLMFALMEANQAGDETRGANALLRARARVVGGLSERRLTPAEVGSFLAQQLPRPIAARLTAILLSTDPIEVAPSSPGK